MSKIDSMKRRAKKLYLQANDFGDLSCGRTLAETLRPRIGIARQKFSVIWSKLREIDPKAPEDPFESLKASS